jgi:branched-chain amino acid transport system substrate-binding protein
MYEHWVDMLNEKGGLLGLPVRLIMYDSGSEAAREIANNIKLITVDKVDLLLGGTPTATMIPTFGAIDKYGYVIMNIGAASCKGLTEPPFENVFSCQTQAEIYSWAMWDWLNHLPSDIKPKKAAIFYGEYSPFTIDHGKACPELAKSVGIDTVYIAGYPAGVTDYTSEVIKMKESGAEILVLCDTEAAPAKLVPKAAQAIGWQPKVYWDIQYIYPGFEDPERPGSLIPLTYYTVLPLNHYRGWPDPPFRDVDHWVDFYTKLLGVSPTLANFDFCWPAVGCQILQDAVQATGSLDQKVLKEYIWTHSFYTLAGHLEFNEYKLSVGWTMALGQITGEGKEEVIWPPELATATGTYPRPPWEEYMK